jgi:hypothetical protein
MTSVVNVITALRYAVPYLKCAMFPNLLHGFRGSLLHPLYAVY